MATPTFQVVIDQVTATFPDIPLDPAAPLNIVKLLNDADEEIQSVITLRRTEIFVGFVLNQLQYDIDATDIRIFNADLVHADGSRTQLSPRGTSEMNRSFPGWRGVCGCPRVVGATENTVGGQIFFYPKPNFSNLVISGITNASPPVATTTVAHGLADADLVDIENATGTTLTGSFYAKVTGYTALTFALYADSDLTIPIAAAGVGTAGIIASQQFPIAAIEVAQTTPLTAASPMQALPQIRRLYANAMRYLWALSRRNEQIGVWKAEFEKDLQICQEMVERRDTGVQFQILPFQQNPNFRGRSSGCRDWD